MFDPMKVMDIELSEKVTDITGLDGYIALKGLVRLHGTPLGYIQLPVTNNCCPAKQIVNAVLEQHSWAITRELLNNGLAAPAGPDKLSLEKLLDTPPTTFEGPFPLVTVAVCTRDRTADLEQCLEALLQLDYPNLEFVIVDNAPSSDATEQLVRNRYPQMRYVCESRPGLDWARNRAIIEAKGEIIAYTDDDVIVDPGWATAIAQVFTENPDVMAVTGLVVPYELETKAQILFEMNGGFGRGFERRWCQVTEGSDPWFYHGAGQFGTGANMAYRRTLFNQIGYFDPALDVGTVTNGGGDLEMFFRVLKEGNLLVYEPCAIVRHRHRREYQKLVNQIRNNGIGLYSYFVRSALAYPEERFILFKLGIWWLWWWSIRRLIGSFIRPTRLPRELIVTELLGAFIGLTRHRKAVKAAVAIEQKFGPQSKSRPSTGSTIRLEQSRPACNEGVGVRVVELSQPITDLTDIEQYRTVRLFFTYKDRPLGYIHIINDYQPVSASRLREQLVKHLNLEMFDKGLNNTNSDTFRADVSLKLSQRFLNSPLDTWSPDSGRLPDDIPVSVVIATLDRPDDLYQCLSSLMAQKTNRRVEIIVVDNNPESGLTPSVVSKFPKVKLVSESRKGLAYARNAGFNASNGDIAIATDDDVVLPENWLERIVTPFSRNDVMVVTGNVLPLELETHPQQFFEMYGGLGKGFTRLEANSEWFEAFRFFSAPTWELGATANAAFRSTIFNHPDIGLMDEALGPGMPSGVGEDTYLFYKVAKAGYTIVYEPDAYVWHKHRHTQTALRHQIYGYSKGHVAYNITTFVRDGDLRGLIRIFTGLPQYYFWRIHTWLRRQSDYPISLTLLELKGSLVGFWALMRSWQRVRREGRSEQYVPVSERRQKNYGSGMTESYPNISDIASHQPAALQGRST